MPKQTTDQPANVGSNVDSIVANIMWPGAVANKFVTDVVTLKLAAYWKLQIESPI